MVSFDVSFLPFLPVALLLPANIYEVETHSIPPIPAVASRTEPLKACLAMLLLLKLPRSCPFTPSSLRRQSFGNGSSLEGSFVEAEVALQGCWRR